MVQELRQARVASVLTGPVHDHQARRLQFSKRVSRLQRGQVEVLRDLVE